MLGFQPKLIVIDGNQRNLCRSRGFPPWLYIFFRVVRRDGAVSPAFAFGGANRQVELLKNEGVGFTDESHVDMARFCVRALPYIAE